MTAIDDRPFPKAALAGGGLLVAVALVGVGGLQLARFAAPEQPSAIRTASPLAVRELRFLDRADGAVVVQNARGELAAIVPPGEGGFIRGVLRGLARERQMQGIGSGPVFRLTRWSDGRLTLSDPMTGRELSLGAFGPTNRAAFADLLSASPGDPA